MSPVITLLRAALIAALFTSLSLLGVSGLLDAVPARAATPMKLLAAVKTVAGQNRFDTAIKVSQAQAPTTSGDGLPRERIRLPGCPHRWPCGREKACTGAAHHPGLTSRECAQ